MLISSARLRQQEAACEHGVGGTGRALGGPETDQHRDAGDCEPLPSPLSHLRQTWVLLSKGPTSAVIVHVNSMAPTEAGSGGEERGECVRTAPWAEQTGVNPFPHSRPLSENALSVSACACGFHVQSLSPNLDL